MFSPDRSPPPIALVQDALPDYGGAERVLEVVLEMFPQAPIYTLVYRPSRFEGTRLATHPIQTSPLARLPGALKNHYRYLPLFPYFIEQLDLRQFRIVISFNYAVAHGVVLRPDQLHISYTYTPLRYLWHQTHAFLEEQRGLRGMLTRILFHYLRMWDVTASRRVDHYVAISSWVAAGIRRAYGRQAEVIFPPVATEKFEPLQPRQDYYITVTRLAPHKRIDLIIEAFRQLDRPLIIVGEGPDRPAFAAQAPANITFAGRLPDEQVAALLGRARAFVHVAEEDFGIAPVEAQAAGCPVLAYESGGVRDTVIPGVTGLLFKEQTSSCLREAVLQFEAVQGNFDPFRLQAHAAQFGVERFKREFADVLARQWERFHLDRDGSG